MKPFRLKMLKKKWYSAEETVKINKLLLNFLEQQFGKERYQNYWLASKSLILEKKENGNQQEISSSQELSSCDEDTLDTSTEHKVSESSLSSFERNEINDYKILAEFAKKIDTIKIFIQFLCKNIWTVDVLNQIMNLIFDYSMISSLHQDERFTSWVIQMLQTVRFLSSFTRVLESEIYKYWWNEAKQKISEIYVLKYHTVYRLYDLAFDSDLFFKEIFTPWIPSIILNKELSEKLNDIMKISQTDWKLDELFDHKNSKSQENNFWMQVKKNLYFFYTSVITNKSLDDTQRGHVIKKLLKMLNINEGQLDILNTTIWENKDLLLIHILYSLFCMLGIDKEYYLEHLLLRYNKYGEKYNIKEYKLSDTQSQNEESKDDKYLLFMSGIKYINYVLCQNSTEIMSLEIKLWLIEMMGKMFPEYYNEWKTLEDKQDFFIRIYKFYQIANKHSSKSLFFGEGMIRYFLSGLRYSLDDQSLVEVSLDTMIDSFGLSKFYNYLEKVLCFIVMASLKYPKNVAITLKINSILTYYFIDPKIEVQERILNAWQFLFLKAFRSIPEYSTILKSLELKLYKDASATRRSIIELANCLHYEYNNDHKLLCLKFINQLIDKTSTSNSAVKSEMHREQILKYVYESVMKLKTKLKSDIEDTHLLNLYWAKFIASIGIGKTFISEGSYFKPRATDKLSPTEI